MCGLKEMIEKNASMHALSNTCAEFPEVSLKCIKYVHGRVFDIARDYCAPFGTALHTVNPMTYAPGSHFDMLFGGLGQGNVIYIPSAYFLGFRVS